MQARKFKPKLDILKNEERNLKQSNSSAKIGHKPSKIISDCVVEILEIPVVVDSWKCER